MPTLKKGSAEAKKFMAKIRAMKNKPIKVAGAAKKSPDKKVVRQTGTSVKKLDKLYVAKKPGKRVTPTGSTYYENRANRSDKGKLLGIGSMFDTIVIKDLDSLKKQYLKLAKKYHPDSGGTTVQFQKLQDEYEKLLQATLRGSKLNEEEKANEIVIDKEIRAIIDQLVNLENLNVELIGKWLWISGNTYPIKDVLKSAGLIFIKKQGVAYWVFKGVESTSRGKTDMEDIRKKYGSHKIDLPITKKITGVRSINKLKLKKSITRLKLALAKRPI